MANKRVSELQDASLPLQRTDKILVSRDGQVINKANASDLPLPLTTQQASRVDIAGVVAATDSGDLIIPDGGVIRKAGVIYVPTSRALLPSDDSKTLDCAVGVVLTIPAGLVNFGCVVRPAGTQIACSSGVTTNGTNTTKTTAAVLAAINSTAVANAYDLVGV